MFLLRSLKPWCHQMMSWFVPDPLHTLVATLPPSAIELFCVVMRFEFVLKEDGHCRRGRYGEALPDWDDFATNRMGDAFFADVVKRDIAPTLRSQPPSVQIATDEMRLDWDVTAPPANVKELFRAVRRVRNNLFHGGKSGTPDHERDALLIVDALSVLWLALETDSDLRNLFDGRY